MKIWVYVGIIVGLMAAYVIINSSLFDKVLNAFETRPSGEEVTLRADMDELAQNQLRDLYVDSVQDRYAQHLSIDYSQIDDIIEPEPIIPETAFLEIPEDDSMKRDDKDSTLKIVEADTSGSQIDDRYDRILLETLTGEGWESNYLTKISKYLMDPRSEFQPVVLNRNSTHKESKEQYKQYLTKHSVDRCIEFWKSHGEKVTAAINAYDVPSEIIVAILKVESNFGSHKGHQVVFNVFCSLSIADNPEIIKETISITGADAGDQKKRLYKRARWGRSQLFELISLVIDLNNESLLWELSSWAGAFGLPQFIPTSLRAYARDGDNDGVIDLNNISDAAISIANYLKSNGWKATASNSRKKKVIMRYNNSVHYAECILSLADSIKVRIREG